MGRHTIHTAGSGTIQVEIDGQPVGLPPVAVAAAGAATLNAGYGSVTSESITTAAGADYTLTLTNNKVSATSVVLASACFGTSTTGEPLATMVTPAAGSVVIKVRNLHASAAFNGTIEINFVVFN